MVTVFTISFHDELSLTSTLKNCSYVVSKVLSNVEPNIIFLISYLFNLFIALDSTSHLLLKFSPNCSSCTEYLSPPHYISFLLSLRSQMERNDSCSMRSPPLTPPTVHDLAEDEKRQGECRSIWVSCSQTEPLYVLSLQQSFLQFLITHPTYVYIPNILINTYICKYHWLIPQNNKVRCVIIYTEYKSTCQIIFWMASKKNVK